MSRITSGTRIIGLAALAALAGCESQATKDKLMQLTAVSAEKDSLLALVSENTRLMSDISSELNKVKDLKKPVSAKVAPESPLAASVSYRDSLKAKVEDVVDRLNTAEARLAASARRIQDIAARSDSTGTQLAQAVQSIADLRATMENQRALVVAQLRQLIVEDRRPAQLTLRNATGEVLVRLK